MANIANVCDKVNQTRLDTRSAELNHSPAASPQHTSHIQAHYASFYSEHTEQYDRLVAHEDYQGNLLKSLMRIACGNDDWTAAKEWIAVDLGCGTGRISKSLGPHFHHVHGFDWSEHMITRAKLVTQASNVSYAVADHADVPLADGMADLVVEGWAFLHAVRGCPDSWTDLVSSYLREAVRMLRPGGHLVLIETLGTGSEVPVPKPHHSMFFDWLQAERGFQKHVIRTDYKFSSTEEALEVLGHFFKPDSEHMQRIRTANSALVPECTGMWVWQKIR